MRDELSDVDVEYFEGVLSAGGDDVDVLGRLGSMN
jgi:hypothetical protein